MYRNKDISTNSNSDCSSSFDNSNSNHSDINLQEQKIINFKEKLSISDMFKNMTIKDRTSKKFSDLSNFELSSISRAENEFMTSSPIKFGSVLCVPKFIKNDLILARNTDANAGQFDDFKENLIKIRKRTSCKDTTGDVILEDKKKVKRPLIRSNTVRNDKKPEIGEKTKALPKNIMEKSQPINSLNRSASIYRSTASLNSNKVTVPKPFSFENKDKMMLENRVKIVQEDLLEKKRIANAFKANPMPISSPRFPEKMKPKSTIPVLFKFESDQRIQFYNEKKLLKSSLDNSMMLSINSNKSSDTSVLTKPHFVPKPSSKPPTIPETPMLSIQARLKQRKKFDDQIQQISQKVLEIKEEMEKERIEKENFEYLQLRRTKLIKAKPIRRYKKIEITHNSKFTIPQTPNFSNRLKK